MVAGGLELANVIRLQHRTGNRSMAVDLNGLCPVPGILITYCQDSSQNL